jgi:hypothetical protein
MDALRTFIIIAFAAMLLGLARLAQAQGTLQPFQPVEGRITPGSSQDWTFTVADGAIISLVARATSGDLDPVITLRNRANTVIIHNDDYDYPANQDAVLEAITLTRRDTYTVTVSGFGDTAGSYLLTMQPGFADMAVDGVFDTSADWRGASDDLVIDSGADQLALLLAERQQRGAALYSAPLPEAFYAQADVLEVSGREGWFVGMTFRAQDTDNYYLYEIDHRGQWRVVAHASGQDRVLRDWTTHPAITAGHTSFRISVLARGTSLEFFYNDLLLGRINDSALAEPGHIGLSVATTGAVDPETIARFAALRVTTPLDAYGEPVIPHQIIVSNNANNMIQDLQRRGLIPTQGRLSLTIQQSSASLNRPGINEILLGGGQTFRNQAVGTSVSWQSQQDGAVGCGLILRAQDRTHYTLAYIDQTGGYGISRRADDTFEPGLHGQNPALAGLTSHHLLIIADEDTLHYYINGELAGSTQTPAVEGALGSATVNFEPIPTTCQFTDTWLWSW